ncbi:hypothetical protein PQI07_16490 [Methylobacterium sp. 092160098-2]|uniref:hypothetical protein n=1 Tax=Methylobacterium sp. 092160098-2 TaxID=3025129 RepID=UPI002381B410|nr:hypothetical protein [Methylobacterium sp. 092160098-2]MDE4912281.1 hypothetical protein [Methylobacterium sp. 092160098-2]
MTPLVRLELVAPSVPEPGDIRLGRAWVDGREGELVYVGREPHLDGPDGRIPIPREAYGIALVEALDTLAGGVWGDDWSSAVADLTGMNRRSTARDRVRKQGLPPNALAAVVRIARRHDAREFAALVRAAARYLDAQRAVGADSLFTDATTALVELRGLRALDPTHR